MDGAGAVDATVIESARQLDKRAVSRLISLFEDSRTEARVARDEVIDALGPSSCVILGLTGTPGSGKSTLVGTLVPAMLERRPDTTVAVLAIDPSSHASRGALLGDRTRVRLGVDDRRSFFRSQASATALGGLAPTSFEVTRLLAALFDVVIVETVGIGQSELDIRHLADHVMLVLQPLGGDEVQFLKAGIIEIPDRFVINKCDEPGARRSVQQLSASISLARPFDEIHPPIHMTSATTGEGVGALADALVDVVDRGPTLTTGERNAAVMSRWVSDEWGRVGERFLAASGGAAQWLTDNPPGRAATLFEDALVKRLRS